MTVISEVPLEIELLNKHGGKRAGNSETASAPCFWTHNMISLVLLILKTRILLS